MDCRNYINSEMLEQCILGIETIKDNYGLDGDNTYEIDDDSQFYVFYKQETGKVALIGTTVDDEETSEFLEIKNKYNSEGYVLTYIIEDDVLQAIMDGLDESDSIEDIIESAMQYI